MAFPKSMSRNIDGKVETMTVENAEAERQARVRGWFDDADKDGKPDAPNPGSEFPKMLHGTDREGKPMTKVVKNVAEEKAAKAQGWSTEPAQDHGPVEPVLETSPKSEEAAAKKAKK